MTIDELNALATLTAGDEIPVWDSEESGEPTKKITAQNMTASVKALGSLVNTSEMNDAIQQSTADVIRTGDVVDNLTSTATDKPGSANMLKTLNDLIKNAQSITVQGTGNFGTTIIRLGYIRIVYMYNGVELQAPISVQLDAKDIPAHYVNVGSWLAISDSTYGSRYVAINQSGILSTSGNVYRGGWNFVYVASSPA